jgi:hypothetical protein
MENLGNLRQNQNLHESLVHMIHRGETGLRELPGLLLKVIEEESWRQRYVPQLEKVVTFDRFIDYVTTAPLEGMGATPDLLRALCKDHLAARSALENALVDKPGKRKVDYIRLNQSNIKAQDRIGQSILSLKRHHSELHARVIAGEISVYEAAVQAGIYPKRISVNTQNVESAAKTILKNCGIEYAQSLLDALAEKINEQN